MRIALDATAYDGRPSGARNRATGLAAALVRAGCDVTMVVPRRLAAGLAAAVAAEFGGPPPGDRFRAAICGESKRSALRTVLGGATSVERALPRGTDLFVTDYLPVLRTVPTVLTLHDLRALDLPGAASRARIAYFRMRYPSIAARAALVTAPTAVIARRAIEVFRLDPSRVAVVPNATGRIWSEALPERPASHLLFIGPPDARKGEDVARLARGRLCDAGFRAPLVIAGQADVQRRLTAEHCNELRGFGLRIVLDPSDAELRELVASASALIHPSRYEGFGIPVLEAFSQGIPVAAAADPAVLEVAGGLAETFAIGDDRGAVLALRRAFSDRRSGRERRIARAREFTWDRAAAELLRAARAVLGRGGGVP